jgi:hypothetical protein
MSLGLFRKLLRCFGVAAFLWLALPTAAWAQLGSGPCATFGTPCAVGCAIGHCPPAFKYTVEGPPRIHWQHGCPRPICNPCDLPHWGFYETCWHPWPYAPTWGCATTPPAAFVTLDPNPHSSVAPPVRPFSGGLQTPQAVPQQYPMNPPAGNGNPIQLPMPRSTVDR